MHIFSFRVTDEPKSRKYYRYGKVVEILFTSGQRVFGKKLENFHYRKLWQSFTDIKRVFIEGLHQKNIQEPYSSFMLIRFLGVCADIHARTFLDQHEISYKTVSVDLVNYQEHTYKMIFFESVKNLINLSKSKLYVDKDGFLKTKGKNYFSPILSKIILDQHAHDIRGIKKIEEMNELICDEQTKKALEKSKLTGFYFEKLHIAD